VQAYAVAFFAVPALRSVLNAARNRAIAVRNAAREAALRLLQQPDQVLRQKLATARAQGQRNVISERWVAGWLGGCAGSTCSTCPVAWDGDSTLKCLLRSERSCATGGTLWLPFRVKCLLSTRCGCCACCACCCRDAIFRSDRGLEQQPTNIEADSFDAKLERRARERQQQQQQGARRQAPPQEAPQWWLDQKARQQQKDRR
jgi:hypothetical protein